MEALAALVEAVNFGLKASAVQLFTWKGVEMFWAAPKVERSSVSVASTPQLVGLTRKPWRLMAIVSVRKRRGMPLKIVGTLPLTVMRPL